ncbi:uncharacterized protein C1orf198 homolog isoform X2 [Ambystoma mexicanum]|uniref:uncharacterized protein C1orf198 homolog isoform X2 n=1 Tax=Ambystoma mexicanum TaxID=8296 RepID=UPI0037E7CC9E
MASMAAAIAAARTTSVSGNRPLDERERKRFTYFSSLSPMARKIMLEKERIRERCGPAWEQMAPREQEQLIDRCLVEPQLQARYALHRGPEQSSEEPGAASSYPSLRLLTGQKVVHFGEEDITWQDEHSAPFSWETRSQMEFSVASLTTQEESGFPVLPIDPKQPAKAVQGGPAPKGAHVTQPTKPSQGSKTPNMDGPAPARKEEESAFWKISAERSKIEGEEAEFHSLTPSQIKSLEKGEKSLPSYYRQESASKDKETARVEKAAVSKQEKAIAQSFPSAASPSKVSEACASSLYPSPSKSSAAYPAVTSAAFPVATSTAHPGPTAAAYSSKPSSAIPNVTSVAYPAMTSAGFSGATSAACPSKASVAYANVASAAPLGVASVTAESKNPRPSQSSVSTLDDVFLPEVLKQSSQVSQTLLNDAADEKEDSFLPDQQRFSEINTNNVVLKTGFDFLDNW